MGLLEGKVAIITGAGGGIGRAVARLFAAHGARLVLNDLGCDRQGLGADPSVAEQVAREISESLGRAVGTSDDAATELGATRLVARALEQFGAVDVLVNSVGIAQDAPLLGLSQTAWDAVVGSQLRGTFLCMQAAARHFVTRECGRIVNTVGRAGLLGAAGKAATAAAEAGIYGLTRTAAMELQQHGILVNAVSPIANTRLTKGQPAIEEQPSLTPEHAAAAALFFASEHSGSRSGCVLAAAGGRLSTFQVVESRGRFKESQAGIWSPEEISEYWESISKL